MDSNIKERRTVQSPKTSTSEGKPFPQSQILKTKEKRKFPYLLFTIFLIIISASYYYYIRRQDVASSVKDRTARPESSTTKGSHGTNEEVRGPDRLLALGDIHGSYLQYLRVLKLADLIEVQPAESLAKTAVPPKLEEIHVKWIAPAGTWLVQTGDIVDRGDDTILLYSMIANLTMQASAAGGRYISTLGNHELMNIMDDLRYVTPGDVASFGGHLERKKAWSSSGWLGKQIRGWDAVARVGNSIFVHGGIHESFAIMSIEAINEAVSKAIKGDDGLQSLWNVPLFADNGPFWYRGYHLEPEKQACAKVERMLKKYKAARIVMGHTPQTSGNILRRCNGKIFVVDLGISPVYGGNLGLLEIRNLTDQSTGKIKQKVTGIYPNGKRTSL